MPTNDNNTLPKITVTPHDSMPVNVASARSSEWDDIIAKCEVGPAYSIEGIPAEVVKIKRSGLSQAANHAGFGCTCRILTASGDQWVKWNDEMDSDRLPVLWFALSTEKRVINRTKKDEAASLPEGTVPAKKGKAA